MSDTVNMTADDDVVSAFVRTPQGEVLPIGVSVSHVQMTPQIEERPGGRDVITSWFVTYDGPRILAPKGSDVVFLGVADHESGTPPVMVHLRHVESLPGGMRLTSENGDHVMIQTLLQPERLFRQADKQVRLLNRS